MPEKCLKEEFKQDSNSRGAEVCLITDVWIEDPVVISEADRKMDTCCFVRPEGSGVPTPIPKKPFKQKNTYYTFIRAEQLTHNSSMLPNQTN